MASVKLVYVVFKTHLDIGYTDLAARVTDNYLNVFIPKAISTAQELRRRGGRERFVWTTGSWLIHTFLKRADEKKRAALSEAIQRGDIAWHACPFTTHTELMDARLFDYGLSLSADLDRQFGKTTVAAKMTDVPGHTIGIVPLMAKRGVKYLHIGVNGGSHMPEVPRVFKWRADDGSELLVQYDSSYGETLVMPGMEEALVVVNALDNNTPPDADAVVRIFSQLSGQFPGAEIRASTLDAIVPALAALSDIPIVSEEIGDTWIHGVGSDPLKVARYRELLRLGRTWEENGKLRPGTPEYGNFYDELIMVPEHTWGMDVKLYLSDYTHWSIDDFHKARKADKVEIPAGITEFTPLTDMTREIQNTLYPDNPELRGRQSYSVYESSHREQRAYIDAAIRSLPEELQKEAGVSFRNLAPRREIDGTEYRSPGEPFTLGQWRVTIGDSGALTSIRTAEGRELAGEGGVGAYSYQTFSHEDYLRFYKAYCRGLYGEYWWVVPDFGKPGMDYAKPYPRNAFFNAHIRSIRVSRHDDADEAAVLMKMPSDTPRGAPQTVIIRYRAVKNQPKLELSLDWFDKEATRLPEALWLGINLSVATAGRWRYSKLAAMVNPLDTVKGGNRGNHAIGYAGYQGCDGQFKITPLDSPLAAPGSRKMLRFDDRFEDPSGGIYFNL
ncbi:MAG: DUF5054 domain-containing protein, partial [Treponema sp.]|nr:DUF5054 domain-containing protein [Treponema sp.]